MRGLFKQVIILLVIMLPASSSNATEVTLKEYRIDPMQRINVAEPKLPHNPALAQSFSKSSNGVLSVNIHQLKDHPVLVKKALLSSLLINNPQGVALLLPVFKQQEPDNLFYIHWSEAIIAHHHAKYQQAIKLYQKVLAENPQAIAAHLQLAITLYQNYDNHAAHQAFIRVKQQAIPDEVINLVNQYLHALQKRRQWQFSGNMNYLDDNNVNNAPKPGTRVGFWTTASPESAKGAGYYARAKKKTPLIYHLFSAIEIYGYGKYYITNHKYDEATVRMASGVGWQNATTEITLLPFFEQSWYAGGHSSADNHMKRYVHIYGGRAEINQAINNHWLISGAMEYGRQEYYRRDYLNGDNILFSAVLIYAPDSRSYWFAGSDYYQENTKEKESAYRRSSARVGWSKKFKYGINSRITGSYARRNYFAKDFFGIQRNTKEYTLQTSLWHEDIQYLGFTPVIVWSYRKNNSNHPFYRYEKNRIYLEIEKKFR